MPNNRAAVGDALRLPHDRDLASKEAPVGSKVFFPVDKSGNQPVSGPSARYRKMGLPPERIRTNLNLNAKIVSNNVRMLVLT